MLANRMKIPVSHHPYKLSGGAAGLPGLRWRRWKHQNNLFIFFVFLSNLLPSTCFQTQNKQRLPFVKLFESGFKMALMAVLVLV